MAADTGNYRNLSPKKRNSFEILYLIGESKTEAERLKVIKEHLSENLPFKQLIMWNFLPRIKSALPEGNPEFIRNKMDGEHHSLWEYLKMFPFFVVSAQSQRMNNYRQERLFIDMLEAIPEKEAEVVLLVKDKDLESKNPHLTPGILFKADPILFAPLEEVAKERKNASIEKAEEDISEEKGSEGSEVSQKKTVKAKSQKKAPAGRKASTKKRPTKKQASAKEEEKGPSEGDKPEE